MKLVVQASLATYSNPAEGSQPARPLRATTADSVPYRGQMQPQGAEEHLEDWRVAAKYSMFEVRNPPNMARPRSYRIWRKVSRYSEPLSYPHPGSNSNTSNNLSVSFPPTAWIQSEYKQAVVSRISWNSLFISVRNHPNQLTWKGIPWNALWTPRCSLSWKKSYIVMWKRDETNFKNL